MNCNPFTNGHRYLIEKALENCDFLYVFVVEENKSEFSFTDRYNLVREGVKDLGNVAVVPRGRFIISTVTFPEYFDKASVSTAVDTTFDVTIFAKYIAGALGISVRFVGNEPM